MRKKPHVWMGIGGWRCSDWVVYGRGKTPSEAYNAWALEALAHRYRVYREGSARK